jgi:enoyl-CoA hydratase/carnithine racemase
VTVIDIPPEAGVQVSVAGAVASITLSAPERLNSQTPDTWAALLQARDTLAGSVRVVVLRGAGRAFSAGLDRALFAPNPSTGRPAVADLATGTVDEAAARLAGWQRAFDWTSRADLVSIAAVQGYAIGAGFQLALGADIRLLADDAFVAMAEPTLGLVPDLGGTKRLVDLVGYSRATDLCLTGRRVPADEALRIGLASRVVPLAELDVAVSTTVDALLAIDPDTSAATKRLLLAAGSRTQREQERAEGEEQYLRLRALLTGGS